MPSVDNTVVIQTANVSLSNTEANLTPANAPNGIPVYATGPGRSGYIALALVTVPNVTGVSSLAAITVNVRAGSSSSGTLLGSATATNNAAGSSATGSGTIAIPIPAGTQNVFVGAVLSSGTGTAQASPTAPLAVTLLLLD